MNPIPNIKVLVAVVLAAGLLAGGAAVALLDGDDTKTKTMTVPAAPPAGAGDGPDKDTARDDALSLNEQAQDGLEDAVDATTKPGDEYREIADPLRERLDPSQTAAGVLDGPLAAQEFPGCRTRLTGNFSSRNGAPVGVIVWHQTVSFENGWSSQNALTARASDVQSGVSWHLLIGRSSGRCTYTVPLNMKAWTQGNGNPVAIGIEVEAYGSEASYVTGAGERRLLAATRELGRRFNIPMRHGKVTFDSRCRPTVVVRGIVEHSDLGPCGGGHVDTSSTAFQRGARPEVAGWRIEPLIAKAAIKPCGPKCRRRKEHAKVHAELKRRHCAPPSRSRSEGCRALHARNRQLHRAGL